MLQGCASKPAMEGSIEAEAPLRAADLGCWVDARVGWWGPCWAGMGVPGSKWTGLGRAMARASISIYIAHALQPRQRQISLNHP